MPWFLNGFFKETDKFFTTNFSSLPPLADYCDNVNDLIYDSSLELKPRKEHIIDDNFERFRHPLSPNYYVFYSLSYH